jgi:hypothetical protein
MPIDVGDDLELVERSSANELDLGFLTGDGVRAVARVESLD